MNNWEQVVTELDALRYVDPELALSRVSEALDECPAEAAAQLLGISGSALLKLLRLPEAKADIEAGIAVAEAIGDLPILAGNYQRLAYVVSDENDFQGAMEITAEAICLYETLGDSAGVGRCLVDRGKWLFNLDCNRLAVLSFRRSLKLLPADEQRNRFTAFQTQALSFLELENLPEAITATSKARELAGVCGEASFAALDWLEGRLQFAAVSPSAAVAPYSEALDFYLGGFPCQAALVGVELVAAQFLAGNFQAAAFTANRLLEVIGNFSTNKIVCDALQRLIQCEALSTAIVAATWERVLRELEPSSRRWRQLARPAFSH